MKKWMAVFLCLIQISQAGCATIVHGDKQTVRVETNPPGASVTIVGRSHGEISPADLILKRKNDYELEIKKEGYQTQYVAIDQHLGGWFWMNLLSWGIIGFIVDMSKGSGYNLRPVEVNVTLESAGSQIE